MSRPNDDPFLGGLMFQQVNMIGVLKIRLAFFKAPASWM